MRFGESGSSEMEQLNHQNRLAVDVGGTFTDVVLDTGARLVTAKVATDVEHPDKGILAGIQVVLQRSSTQPSQINALIHGTTLATNALIERKGAKTAFITTKGFRDSLEIGYENRYDQYDLSIEKAEPIIARRYRFTVSERIDVRGNVLIDLNQDDIKALVPILREQNIAAVAVGLLHSYANPSHEQLIRDILIEAGCEAEISLSCEVCPEVREYERFMTTACNAYVQPVIASYLIALNQALEFNGFQCPLFLMTSGGAMTTLESAIRFPIRLVESGPSGGAVLASCVAEKIKEPKVLSFDMGGTTAKICLIDDFKPRTARNFEIARSARFQKGSGLPVRIPVVEMIEIGAGGGSIAHIDSLGRLAIGPESAGSIPGPACYQKGGDRVTVTDADLLLGRLDADNFAEGKLRLEPRLALTCVERDIAKPMQIESIEAAYGICEMVEENMANAARIHSVEHGSDLTQYSMIAFGGAGPLHAVRLAQKLNINTIIVPDHSSVGSAIGFLRAPIAYEVVRSRYRLLSQFDAEDTNQFFYEIGCEAYDIVQSGSGDAELLETRTAFMRYVGQGHEIEVPLPVGQLNENHRAEIQASYEGHYEQLYGRIIPQRDIEILSWGLVVSTVPESDKSELQQAACSRAVPQISFPVYLPEVRELRQISVYQRDELKPGASFDGPALLAEAQTTTFVTSEFSARIDAYRNLILERKPSS